MDRPREGISFSVIQHKIRRMTMFYNKQEQKMIHSTHVGINIKSCYWHESQKKGSNALSIRSLVADKDRMR